MKKLIDSGEDHYEYNKISRTYCDEGDEITTVLWENCDINTKETFPGEELPKQTPWGIGKFTRDGCNYIFRQLQKEGRCSWTL